MQTKVSKEELIEYLGTHTRYETAKHFKLGHKNFIAHLKYFGIEDMGFKRKHGPHKKLPDKDVFTDYFRSHSLKECKEHFGLGEWALGRCLEEYGLKPMLPHSPIARPSRKTLREYFRTHSSREASEKFGVGPEILRKWRSKCKIAKRPLNTVTFSEAAKMLGVTRATITNRYKKGLIAGVISNGHKNFMPKNEVDRLMNDINFNKVKPRNVIYDTRTN